MCVCEANTYMTRAKNIHNVYLHTRTDHVSLYVNDGDTCASPNDKIITHTTSINDKYGCRIHGCSDNKFADGFL